jgi:NHL repeat.
MNRGLKKQVHPVVAAVLIIAVLVAVQWAWWKGLVYKPPPGRAPRGGGGGGSGPAVTVLAGRAGATVETLAGDLEPGDADGPGHAARFDRPTALAMDVQGNLFVADTGNHRIRKITPEGDVTTVAGSSAGLSDGAAGQAQFNAPCGVAVAPDGTLFVADTGNSAIRSIRNGQVATIVGKPLQSLSGQPDQPLASAVAYVTAPTPHLEGAEAGRRQIRQYSLDGSLLGQQSVPGPPVSAASPSGAYTVPMAGAIVAAGKTWKNVPLDGATGADFVIRKPVGICSFESDWLLTDG